MRADGGGHRPPPSCRPPGQAPVERRSLPLAKHARAEAGGRRGAGIHDFLCCG
jgi:hypothetical protein